MPDPAPPIRKAFLKPRIRRRKAYSAASRVAWSYLRLKWLSKLFGQAWYDQRIEALHDRNSARVKRVILQLQGLFIKFGQLMSILSNVLPEAFRQPLEALQDKIPARPYAEVAGTIESELGHSPEVLFQRFEPVPLAAASIGQAHMATASEGKVVVKIQHAGIDQIAEADLKTIRKLLGWVAWFFNIKGLDFIYTQVVRMIREELDFEQEANYLREIGGNLREEPGIIVPRVIDQMSSTRVMTTVYAEGVKISRIDQLDEWGIDKHALAERLLRVFCKMIMVDGVYHADPHPGNIHVDQEGNIILLDFGAVGRLGPDMKAGIPKLVEAVLQDNVPTTVEVLKLMGFVGSGREVTKVAERLLKAFRNFFQNELQLESLNPNDLTPEQHFENLERFRKEFDLQELSSTFQIPKDWVLLYRSILLLSGISFQLAPKLNPLNVLLPYLEENIFKEEKSLKNIILSTLKQQVVSAASLPQDLQKFLNQAQQGELEVEITGFAKGLRLLYVLGQQLIMALLFISSSFFGYLFYATNVKIATVFGALAAAFLFFFIRAWFRGGSMKF